MREAQGGRAHAQTGDDEGSQTTMPLDTLHPAVARYALQWEKIDDCVEGEDRIKALDDKYLPRLNYRRNDARQRRKYDDYKQRAEFPDILSRTVKGVLGLLFRRPPTVTVPKDQLILLNDVTGTGMSFEQFARHATTQLIAPGRGGIMVDATADGRAKMVLYTALNIVKWWTRRRADTGTDEVYRAVLRECILEADPRDVDNLIPVTRWREMRLITGAPPDVDGKPVDLPESGRPVFLAHQLWRKNDRQELMPDGPPIVIVRQGRALDEIPFIPANATSVGWDTEPPIMLGLANTVIGMYRTSADLENGRHWTGRPQPYWFGIDRKNARGDVPEIEYGSSVVWTSRNADAKAGFVAHDGSTLVSLENAYKMKKELAVEQGARLVEARPVELTATQSRLRDESEKSVVMTLAETASDQLTRALVYFVWFSRPGVTLSATRDAVNCTLNPDRGAMLEPAAAKAWAEVQLYGNGLTLRELFDLYKRAGVYDDTVTFEQHTAELAAERAAAAAQDPSTDTTDNDGNDPADAGA